MDHNSVVAKLADKLPVKIEARHLTTSDGFSWNFEDRAVGLLYYNPAAPQRLIFWVASNSSDFYKPGTPMMRVQRWMPAGPDFIIMHAAKPIRVAARRFDSRWRWESGYGDSPIASASWCLQGGAAAALAQALRRATGADFALVQPGGNGEEPLYAAGETRKMDVVAWEYDVRLAAMELTGREILQFPASQEKNTEDSWEFLPTPRVDNIRPGRMYRVTMIPWTISSYAKQTRSNPESFRLLNGTVREALRRHLGQP